MAQKRTLTVKITFGLPVSDRLVKSVIPSVLGRWFDRSYTFIDKVKATYNDGEVAFEHDYDEERQRTKAEQQRRFQETYPGEPLPRWMH